MYSQFVNSTPISVGILLALFEQGEILPRTSCMEKFSTLMVSCMLLKLYHENSSIQLVLYTVIMENHDKIFNLTQSIMIPIF